MDKNSSYDSLKENFEIEFEPLKELSQLIVVNHIPRQITYHLYYFYLKHFENFTLLVRVWIVFSPVVHQLDLTMQSRILKLLFSLFPSENKPFGYHELKKLSVAGPHTIGITQLSSLALV